jgi:methylase of polypeptide subunit release factors
MNDRRRVYYDHEMVYGRIRNEGGTGWPSVDLKHFEAFLESEFCPKTGRALDLGCGGGELAILLAQRDWDVTGIEYSETALTMARENVIKAGVRVELLRGDVARP